MTAEPPAAKDSAPVARSLRFGLAGTGHWAQITHAPALASTPGIEFTAVWGRNAAAAGDLAKQYGVPAYHDFDEFLSVLDGVAFSIPPDVQSALALRAANAGKHLLLEKPVSTDAGTAAALARAAADAKVASVVFFIARFHPAIRDWLAAAAEEDWLGGNAVWLGSALAPASPFNTPWRHDKGGLWDLGPHALSVLWASLGPVVSVMADAGVDDLSYLILHHEGGASSAVTVTLSAPPAGDGFDLYLWGEQGRSVMPALSNEPVAALRLALTELIDSAQSPSPSHPCDVRFGLQVTRVLGEAHAQMVTRRS